MEKDLQKKIIDAVKLKLTTLENTPDPVDSRELSQSISSLVGALVALKIHE